MNEINLEKTKQELKDRGIILSEQGLFIDMPRIFSIPPDEDGLVLGVKARLPATFPILSFDIRRAIERNLKKTLTGYSIEAWARFHCARVGPKSQQKTVWGWNVCGDFEYHVGSNSKDLTLLSFWVDEAVILEESRRLTTCERFWSAIVNRVPVPTNYVITTINDTEIPIYRTNVIKKSQTDDCVRIDAYRHKIYKRKWHESSFSIAKAIAEGRTPKERYRTYKGLPLSGVGIPFPLDETNSFHFIFAGRGR